MASARQQKSLIIRHLGLQDFAVTYEAMKTFIAERNVNTSDEIWF